MRVLPTRVLSHLPSDLGVNQSCLHLMSFASWNFFPNVLFATEYFRCVLLRGRKIVEHLHIILYDFVREGTYAQICHMCLKNVIRLAVA